MTCPDRATLQDWLDDELAARRFAIVEKHVLDCRECRGFVRSWQAERELLQDASQPPLDLDDFVARLKKRMDDRD